MMADDNKLALDRVDEATLESLQRRIESPLHLTHAVERLRHASES